MVQPRAVCGAGAAVVLALVAVGCSSGRTGASHSGSPSSASHSGSPSSGSPSPSSAPSPSGPAAAATTATGQTSPASSAEPSAPVPSRTPVVVTPPPSQPAPPLVAAGTPALRTRPAAGRRLILTDSRGFTLYRYDGDVGGIACTGGCLAHWHPLLAAVGARPVPAAGLDPALVGAEHRPDSGLQVTWRGAPLYTYAGDVLPGQVLGDGVGGVWHLVAAPGPAPLGAGTASPG